MPNMSLNAVSAKWDTVCVLLCSSCGFEVGSLDTTPDFRPEKKQFALTTVFCRIKSIMLVELGVEIFTITSVPTHLLIIMIELNIKLIVSKFYVGVHFIPISY